MNLDPDSDPDPDWTNVVDPEPDTINPDPHHCKKLMKPEEQETKVRDKDREKETKHGGKGNKKRNGIREEERDQHNPDSIKIGPDY